MNSNLNAAKTAKTAKSDEFYTQYQDIDNEVNEYLWYCINEKFNR